MTARPAFGALLLVLLAARGEDARAQGAPPVTGAEVPVARPRLPFEVSGEIGTSAESYTRLGRDALRPQSTGEFYLRSTVRLFDRISADVDLLFSTADGLSPSGPSGAGFGRQRLNRLGIAPAWGWGKVFLGSFTDTYSRLTFGGVRVNGAGLAINPGLLRVAGMYGLTDQALLGGATDGSYRRRIAGGRIGVGRGLSEGGESSFFDLSLVRAWDDVGSLQPVGMLPDGTGGLPVNTFAVTPQENVVIGANGALDLLQGRVRLTGEASAAGHSRDRRAPVLDPDQVPAYPGFLRALLTPRVSSHADYAYRAEATYRIRALPGASPGSPRTLDLAAEVSHIGPGYVSLGVPTLPADQRAYGVRGQLRFANWNLGLNARLQHDNLADQKFATTGRAQFGGHLTLRPSSRWTASLRAMALDIGNGTADPARRIEYHSRSASMSHAVAFTQRGPLRSLTLNYGYRDAGDADPARASATLVAHTADLRVALSQGRTWHFAPSLGVVRARSGTLPWSTRETLGLTTTARMLDGRWTSTLALGTSRASAQRTARASVSSQFEISDAQSISLNVSAQQFRDPARPDADVDEYVTYLRFTRRFP